MIDALLIVGFAWVVIGFEWSSSRVIKPSLKQTSKWSTFTSFGTLDGGQEVVVQQASYNLTTSIPAADGKQEKTVTEETHYRPARVKNGVASAIPSTDGRDLFRGGVANDAMFPTMVAEADWIANKPTGGAGPIGPQRPEPQPEPRPDPTPQGPAGDGPPVSPPPSGGLGGGFEPDNPYGGNIGNLGGGLL